MLHVVVCMLLIVTSYLMRQCKLTQYAYFKPNTFLVSILLYIMKFPSNYYLCFKNDGNIHITMESPKIINLMFNVINLKFLMYLNFFI